MKHRYLPTPTFLLSLIVPLALAVSLSGCLLFGLGAAAGAAVGGCSVLDDNDDDRVTEAEFSAGLYNEWDDDGNDLLTESEFDAGVDRSAAYADWDTNFDAWDDDSDNNLTEAEFSAGVAADADVRDRLDDECDDLGL